MLSLPTSAWPRSRGVGGSHDRRRRASDPFQDPAFALLEILNQAWPESSEAHAIGVADGWINQSVVTALADFVSQLLTSRIADRRVRVKTIECWILIPQIDKVRLEVCEQFDVAGLVVEVAAGRVRRPRQVNGDLLQRGFAIERAIP
jgi:hypothetical protein